MMKSNLYIGEFPPPLGGVTIKNELIKDKIYNNSDITFFDLYKCKKNMCYLFILLFEIIVVKQNIIFGIGSNKRLERLLRIVKIVRGSKKLGLCSIIMMGSTLQNYAKDNTNMLCMLKEVKKIFTESNMINKEFACQGINCTETFPNCRSFTLKNSCCKILKEGDPIKLVFISKVCKEKGAHFLFDVIKGLEKKGIPLKLDYYGIVDPKYKECFYKDLNLSDNAYYKGVFDPNKENIFAKLSEYDILLFPTTWIGEGISGILVESKIAGIPAIVTDHNYNSEVVINNREGIVVSKNGLIENFINAISELYDNPDKYAMMAKNALESSSKYDLSNYVNSLQSVLH